MIPDKEIESFWNFIRDSVDRLLACLEGLDEADLNWRPLENANSLYVLANHTISNIERNILGILCYQKISQDREEAFEARGNSAEPLQQKWNEIQKRVSSCLAKLSAVDLNQEHDHPRRDKITGRDALLVVARHAAEHMGQAFLTRDLLFTARGRELPARRY